MSYVTCRLSPRRSREEIIFYTRAMLTRQQKEQQVADLHNKLGKIKSLIFTDYSGVRVDELTKIRRNLKEQGIDYKVIKNRLFKIALNQRKIDIEKNLLERPLAAAFSYQDEVAPAKILSEAQKQTEALEILGGIYNDRYIDQKEVMKLAKLPGRDELLAKIAGSLNAPISGLVNVLAGNMRGLINVLSQYQLKSQDLQ